MSENAFCYISICPWANCHGGADSTFTASQLLRPQFDPELTKLLSLEFCPYPGWFCQVLCFPLTSQTNSLRWNGYLTITPSCMCICHEPNQDTPTDYESINMDSSSKHSTAVCLDVSVVDCAFWWVSTASRVSHASCPKSSWDRLPVSHNPLYNKQYRKWMDGWNYSYPWPHLLSSLLECSVGIWKVVQW